METTRDSINHVEMECGRVVGQLQDLTGTGMRRRTVEHIRQRDDRHHPAPTFRARGSCRGIQVIGEGHEPRGFHRV